MAILSSIEIFTATVEAGSFAAAARRLGVTPSAVSRRVALLEREVRVALLARTTRTLRLTDDGRAFHERCVRILTELQEARDALARANKKPAGLLRVDAPVAFARGVLGPALPRFLERYPEIRLDLTLRDQHVDPVAEGVDLLVRIGKLGDSSLIARKLGASRIVHCASPRYLARHGKLTRPEDLAKHRCLGYLRDGLPAQFSFTREDKVYNQDIAGPFNANDADLLYQLAVAGHGVAAMFDFIVRDAITRGELVEVLPDHPSIAWPVHALYPKNRHLLPKVSVFIDFLATLCRDRAAQLRRPATRVKSRTRA